ncbi:MAG: hypothetical protein EA353_13265 [Puniceicoccaceae bacterium]|nr:MAG: hypothetical protein EA353_13265 [Puniceicoccaceae bacterium]
MNPFPVRLDRTTFKKQTFTEAAEHQTTYHKMSASERGASFQYLMQVNYGFLGKPWPRLDRKAFSKRYRG